MVHDCTDLLALLGQVDIDLEQSRCVHIGYCLDNQYHALRKNVPANSEFIFGDDLPERIMNVTGNKKTFLHLKLLFNHITPLSKVQKSCVDSLKTLGIATKMGTKTELVNTRNNTAVTTATNISNKTNVKIERSS